MADPVSYGNSERDIEQALITLKKGTQLIKYSRKGKPKFRAFRLSPDETTLIWLSHGEEKNLKLSGVSRIIPGQRTAVFRRYLRPEKDYLSFSLIYNNGDRSLDLICKDKVEAEVWLAGLKALLGRNHNRRTKSEFSDLTDAGDIFQSGRPFGPSLDANSSIGHGRVSVDLGCRDNFWTPASSDVSDHASMQLRGGTGDGFRLSVSSTPSCSSGGSGPDDIESLGDLFVWGEIWNDGFSSDGSVNSVPTKNDVLIPKAMESNVVLDVQQISCGVRHVALVTRQGEIFTWGEEAGGRLGHGVEKDFSHPRLVDYLAVTNVEFVACGHYHTCAVSISGDLYSWGDGTSNYGLLGHGSDASHWIPKRVSGPLEGLQVLSIACGMWHSALATTNGKLFTFGDGTFGVLGHGDRQSVMYPKEVQSLSGLRTVKVACGVWHSAAIVEVMGQAGINVSSRKLFTWGDGDKNRLGHGSKETYLLPTCVSSLIDYNFHQLACGHTMTVALTTSGHVFTMGSTAYGQLGNPNSDGKTPCLVQDRLVGEFVEEISCGEYHVAVLTTRSEVFTWGKGANGRLGHGDIEDRKTPTLVEALKDRHVKNISCGSNFTSSICIHKWVSGADQSVCSGCRQAFGFTRKRHNCYNCGLVHCHACSSKKALKAALAPTPGKPHRVCDACYSKLKAAEAGSTSHITRKISAPRCSTDMRTDRGDTRSSRVVISPTTESVKYLEIKSVRGRSEASSTECGSQVPSLLPLKDIAFPGSLSALQNAWKPIQSPMPQPIVNAPQPVPISRPGSPSSRSRRASPPRTSTSGFPRSIIDSLRKTNKFMKQDMTNMQTQIKTLKQKSDVQEMEIQKLQKQAKDATTLAAAESSKVNVAKEVVTWLTEQLKDLWEQLPPDAHGSETFREMSAQIQAFLRINESSAVPAPSGSLDSDQQNASHVSPSIIDSYNMQDEADATEATNSLHDDESNSSTTEENNTRDNGTVPPDSTTSSVSQQSADNDTQDDGNVDQDSNGLAASRITEAHETSMSRTEEEMIEQFEHGVFVTFIQDANGSKIFKRVRFSKRRFKEQQAEEWWKENKERLLRKYRPVGSSTAEGANDGEQSET